jgi:hypothetical protein
MRRRVAVAAHDRGAGQGKALLRADDVHDALAAVELVEIFDAEVLGVLCQRLDLFGALRIRIGEFAIRRRHVVIDHGKRFFGRAHLAAGRAQSLERLRARHLVHEMAIDVEQAGSVRGFVDQMVVPDLVVEGTHGHQ